VFIYINSLFFLFLAAILLSCKEKPRNAIEKTILNYDWKGIVNECKKIDPSLESPVNKALVGHASIMLNRNNESFVLFNFLDLDRKGMKMLQKWTDDLTKRFPKNAIAFYLKGDALVRNGDRKEALQCFEKSISLDKSFS
jgi:tetratricopeptide (TPR) repeat protein